MSETETEDRAKKERSPSFPFIPLRKAVERSEAAMASHKRSATRTTAIGETWGYSPASSGLIQTVAALKAYGLLNDVGRGEDRRVALSDLALRILSDDRPGARETALRDAATRPKLLKEYISSWSTSRPSDSHCLSELTLDRGFNREAAKGFLRVFDDNLAFAGLKEGDKTEPVLEDEAPVTEDIQTLTLPATLPRPIDPTSVKLASYLKQPPVPVATLPLPEGVVSLAMPNGLSERSMKMLRAWLEVIVEIGAWQPDAAPSESPSQTA